MRSPAFAIGWQLWWRHRCGLAAVGAYLVAVVLLVQTAAMEILYKHCGGTAPEPIFHLYLGSVSMLPLVVALTYLVGIFSHGYQTDLAAPLSGYPARMFTLPVPTRTLVLGPMLSGAITLVLGWLAVAQLILRPCGIPVALGWPVLLATALLTWSQALLWWPFGLRGVRLLVLALALPLLFGGVEAAKAYEINPGLLASLLAGWTLAGGLVAFTAVARARSGEEPDWQWLVHAIRQRVQWLPRRRKPFASAAGAQVWFEWRRHGLAFPVMVLGVTSGLLLPLGLGQNEEFPLSKVLLFVLMIPPLVAGMAGTTVAGSNPEARDYYGLPSFTAVRPMTCSALIAAKVKMAALSTLTAWVLLALLMVAAVVLSGNRAEVVEWWESGLQVLPAWRLAGLLALAMVGLIVLTWKRFVENLFIGLTGNAWVINGFIFGGLVLTVVLSLLGFWIYHHAEYHESLLRALAWGMGLAVGLKLFAAGGVLRALRRHRILREQTVAVLLALWLMCVVGLFALLAWLVPAGTVPLAYVALGVVVFVPLTRLLAAPLALAWNRHR